MKNINNKLFWWSLVLLWGGIIFGLSNIQDLDSGLEYDFTLRKIGHSVVFLILFFLLVKANSSEIANLKKVYKLSFLFTFLYAVSDEFHQKFVPGRNGNIMDVFIDISSSFGFLFWENLSFKTNLLKFIKNKQG